VRLSNKLLLLQLRKSWRLATSSSQPSTLVGISKVDLHPLSFFHAHLFIYIYCLHNGFSYSFPLVIALSSCRFPQPVPAYDALACSCSRIFPFHPFGSNSLISLALRHSFTGNVVIVGCWVGLSFNNRAATHHSRFTPCLHPLHITNHRMIVCE